MSEQAFEAWWSGVSRAVFDSDKTAAMCAWHARDAEVERLLKSNETWATIARAALHDLTCRDEEHCEQVHNAVAMLRAGLAGGKDGVMGKPHEKLWILTEGAPEGAIVTVPAREVAAVLVENERLRAIVDAINELRDKEVSAVTIPHDNPDFGGPANVVEVVADWTGSDGATFYGDSLAEALANAVAAKRKALAGGKET